MLNVKCNAMKISYEKLENLSNEDLWNILVEDFNPKVFADFVYDLKDSSEFQQWATETIANELSEEELIEQGWLEDTRIDDLYEELYNISGTFFVVGTNKRIEEDDYDYETLGEAVNDAMASISEGVNRIVIDKDGNVLFDTTDYRNDRERYAMDGTRELDLLEEGLTDYAKSLM